MVPQVLSDVVELFNCLVSCKVVINFLFVAHCLYTCFLWFYSIMKVFPVSDCPQLFPGGPISVLSSFCPPDWFWNCLANVDCCRSDRIIQHFGLWPCWPTNVQVILVLGHDILDIWRVESSFVFLWPFSAYFALPAKKWIEIHIRFRWHI